MDPEDLREIHGGAAHIVSGQLRRMRGSESGLDPVHQNAPTDRRSDSGEPSTAATRSTQQAGFREPAGEALGVLRPQRASADVFAERILRVDLVELRPYPARLVDLA
jgi:hypothetical protein